jgi:hypothetical protein
VRWVLGPARTASAEPIGYVRKIRIGTAGLRETAFSGPAAHIFFEGYSPKSGGASTLTTMTLLLAAALSFLLPPSSVKSQLLKSVMDLSTWDRRDQADSLEVEDVFPRDVGSEAGSVKAVAAVQSQV